MKKKILFSIVIACLYTNNTVFAQAPANDTVDNAITLIVGNSEIENTVTGTTVGSTDSASDSSNPVVAPTCSTYSGGDVWHTTTVPSSGNLNILMTSSLIDCVTVYSGTPGNLTFIDCIRQPTPLELTGLTPNDSLYFRVWEIGNDQFGEFEITAYENIPPVNDSILNATALQVGTYESEFSTTGNLINATISTNDVAATTLPTSNCAFSSISDVWYTTTVPSSGNISID